MKYELRDAGDTCELVETTVSSSNRWPIPFTKAHVVDAISELLLADDDVKHIDRAGLIVETRRDDVRLIVGGASFEVKWRYVFGLLA